MFTKLLIANRGAIATRIIRTIKRLGIDSVAVYHEADAASLHVQQADMAIPLGGGTAADTYLNIDKIIAAAKTTGAQAIHPGYGFLSENTEFVRRCEEEGIIFIGPTTEQMQAFGLKDRAREIAKQADVPLVPGSPLLNDLQDACNWANTIGFPIMLKSTAGGGGIGMQVCQSQTELEAAWDSVKRQSSNYFGNDGVFLEKFIGNARHIEVQAFGDGQGTVVSLGERDCSAQRRNQKVLEETPAPNLSDELRQKLWRTAERLLASVDYRNAGTVEFILDADTEEFYFLEVNTRLQVEHGVTEQVWNTDLVEWMVKLAGGDIDNLTAFRAGLMPQGHSIQARVYAEDPAKDFQPSAGLLSEVFWPEADNLRIDHWIESGLEVPALFDPMLAKAIVTASDREAAISQLKHHLEDCRIYGIETNLAYLQVILASSLCTEGKLLTRSLSEFSVSPATFEVLAAGTQTTIQDFPGRQGYWHIGIPPSGPMDSVSFHLGNRLLGNTEDCAGLEITLKGPTLKFNQSTHIVLTGATLFAELDGDPVEMYAVTQIQAGQTLSLGNISGSGNRSYLAITGGINCPDYLGSKSTFTLGQFGGHAGRQLRAGDTLHFNAGVTPQQAPIKDSARPEISDTWNLRVIYGPHGAPDFFTPTDIKKFLDYEWEVHFNSSRTGIRLIGPKPEWARETGGEAGLHPSNIHDNAYAFGTVDFTGDMPVILGPDGPSLGGFVCPFTVVQADLWKLGQLKAGAKVRFVPISLAEANALEQEQQQALAENHVAKESQISKADLTSPIVHTTQLKGDEVVVRVAGDHFVLVEIGPMELDIKRRFRVHQLMNHLQALAVDGLNELTPGIRSLQIHYNSLTLNLARLLEILDQACKTLENQTSNVVRSRIIHLPLSWDDEVCQQAVDKYQQVVRKDAPWCPSNLEFIRRINGLESVQDVKNIVFDASYLVMGLGDVYLGAPVATPLNPKHRLVTTKYNPARTWTAENSVGIGGAYLCVYGMEGPGGYQFVGRTLQMWNRYKQTAEFDKPWLLRFFDQIRFYPVSHDELLQIRREFPLGQYPLQIEETTLDLADYEALLAEQASEIDAFQNRRQAAFDAELEHWRANGLLTYESEEVAATTQIEETAPEGITSVESPVSGSVWKQLVEVGQSVNAGDTLMVLESMKMEIPIEAPVSGKINKVIKPQGTAVTAGQSVIWID